MTDIMPFLLKTYVFLTTHSGKWLNRILENRVNKDKEDENRLDERRGIAAIERPEGKLVWIHAASVGESQSALILINKIRRTKKPPHVLITTGTRTSAALMAKNLPEGVIHQYYPLDHPEWVTQFLSHWYPHAILWMESELWPNMLAAIKARHIPTILINARLSDKSYRLWKLFKSDAQSILKTFSLVLCQTDKDAKRFKKLRTAKDDVFVTDNLKYSAHTLPFDEKDLKTLKGHILNRPVWVYASTHDGEEQLAHHVHEIANNALPDLLTIIVPRHPHRRAQIEKSCARFKLNTVYRGPGKNLPQSDTAIYIADTMGELGLFYRVAPLACIGRSFSRDGGGGHNPIEAAQLDCAVLHGPNVQYQKQIFKEMDEAGAALKMYNPDHLVETVRTLLMTPRFLKQQQERARSFANSKTMVIDRVWDYIEPVLKEAEIINDL